MIEIRKIQPEETYAIRLEVLRNGMDLPVQFSGDEDIKTFHLGIFEDHKLKGICSFMETVNALFETPQFQLRGMATLFEDRGKGFGRLLLLKGIEILKDKGVKTLWCNARVNAVDFYIKLGFLQNGTSFNIPQVGAHYKLYKIL